MPWVNEPVRAPPEPPSVMDNPPMEPQEVAAEVASEFGLDPEDEELLKELLADD